MEIFKILWNNKKEVGKSRKERSELLKSDYIFTIGTEYQEKQLIFLDDTAKYERSLSRTYGYSFSMSKSSFLRCVRYTILPALTLDGFIACDIMRCSCSKERYCSFVYRFISNYQCISDG
ncbi:uncharacterized protein OCT59_026566 [Rhizophagus irregularis]|nr:hypothetical protein OCT59_026566 [Rhizophagus irregularis]CAB4482971.1 unnamed protein product [Rhizophagus irregularis]